MHVPLCFVRGAELALSYIKRTRLFNNIPAIRRALKEYKIGCYGNDKTVCDSLYRQLLAALLHTVTMVTNDKAWHDF